MFSKKATNTDARAELRTAITNAVETAQRGRVHLREIADIIEQCATNARGRDAAMRPIR